MIKGRSRSTGTIHFATKIESGEKTYLVPACGGSRQQKVSLEQEWSGTEITCKRCAKAQQTPATKETPVVEDKTPAKPAKKAAKSAPAKKESTKKTPVSAPVKDKAPAETAPVEKKTKATKVAKVKKTEDNSETAKKIKDLRDSGMAWWKIAHDLGLPGSADTVAKGKAGAARARKIYKQHFGALPERQKSSLKDRKNRKAEKVERARNGKPIFDSETTPEEIKSRIAGKTISWSIDVGKLAGGEAGSGGYAENEAIVHPERLVVENGKDGELCVRFREMHKGGLTGSTRTVRLSAIHTIR